MAVAVLCADNSHPCHTSAAVTAHIAAGHALWHTPAVRACLCPLLSSQGHVSAITLPHTTDKVPGSVWVTFSHCAVLIPPPRLYYPCAAVLQVLTGLGPVSQTSVTTGLPSIAVQLLLGAFVLHGLYGFSPSTPTWSANNRNVSAH